MRLAAVSTLIVLALGMRQNAAPVSSEGASPPPPVVGLRLVIDDTVPAAIRIRAGEQATVAVDGKGTVGLTPILHDSWIELVVVKIVDGNEGGGSTELTQVELNRGDVVKLDAGPIHLEVEWTELVPAVGSNPTQVPAAPCTRCCVVCDGTVACACYVETTCGRCCCPSACECPSGITTDFRSAQATSSGCSTKPAPVPTR